MLSVAMIRVEPGSTPGIGITISDISFLAFSSFVGCLLLFARGIGRMQQRCWKIFSILLPTLLQILGFGDYILHQVRQCR